MNGRKGLYFIMGGTLLLLVVLFSAYIVLGKFQPALEIQRMQSAMSKVQTVNEQSAFSWSRGTGKDRVATSLYLVGQVDLSNPPSMQQDTKFRLFRLRKANGYADLSGEMRTIGDTTYLTYAAPGPDVPGVDFSQKETWVSFAKGELPAWGSVLPGLDAPLHSTDPATEWSDPAILRLRDLLTTADILLVRYDDVTEIVDAHATRLIEARFDPDAIRAFLGDLVRAKEGRDPSKEELVAIGTRAAELAKLSVRLWIGIDDHLLYRAQASGTITESDGEAAVDVLVNLTGYGKPFGGEVPSAKKTTAFSTVMSSFAGTLFSSGVAGSRPTSFALVSNDAAHLPSGRSDGSDDSDGDGLSAVLESFYRTNPNVADTDGDGASDGDEVLSGRNPNGNGSLFGFGLGN